LAPDKRDFATRVKGAVRENFNQSAATYRAFERRHRLFNTLTDALARWMDITPGSLVLDVGCGNGVSCETLRERFDATVHGIDLSEAMIADAKSHIKDGRIHLLVGDGECLTAFIDIRGFDAVMYNTAIFVFPDPVASFREAKCLLKRHGVIGFSFYPRVYAPEAPDLIGWAYARLDLPVPKFRTITSWEKTCQSLREVFGNLATTTFEMPGSVALLTDFFSIPAQSASLFPKLPYTDRAKRVQALFATLAPWEGLMTIGWDMAKAQNEE